MMNEIKCPICGRPLGNLIQFDCGVSHFYCDECHIDISIEEDCCEPNWDNEPIIDDYDECGFNPYEGCYDFDC